MEMGSNIKAVFDRFVMAIGTVETVVKKDGFEFMHNAHLGYITTSPSDLGTGLKARMMLKIPKVSARADFKQMCAGMKLTAQGGVGAGSFEGVWDISNSESLGVSEVALVNAVIEGCAKLVKMEQALETGAMPFEFMPGLGDAPTPGFSADETPAAMPSLTSHNSIMAEVLKSKPSIYDSLKGTKTKMG